MNTMKPIDVAAPDTDRAPDAEYARDLLFAGRATEIVTRADCDWDDIKTLGYVGLLSPIVFVTDEKLDDLAYEIELFAANNRAIAADTRNGHVTREFAEKRAAQHDNVAGRLRHMAESARYHEDMYVQGRRNWRYQEGAHA